jgi:hypothetical protein
VLNLKRSEDEKSTRKGLLAETLSGQQPKKIFKIITLKKLFEKYMKKQALSLTIFH